MTTLTSFHVVQQWLFAPATLSAFDGVETKHGFKDE
jgi:hypothetical protein